MLFKWIFGHPVRVDDDNGHAAEVREQSTGPDRNSYFSYCDHGLSESSRREREEHDREDRDRQTREDQFRRDQEERARWNQ